MQIPQATQTLCFVALSKLHQDQDFTPLERINIFKAFGISDVTEEYQNGKWWLKQEIPDKWFSWVAVLNAQKILANWRSFNDYNLKDKIFDLGRMINTTRAILTGTVDIDSARELLMGDFSHTIVSINSQSNGRFYLTAEVCFIALNVTLEGLEEGLRSIDFLEQLQLTKTSLDREKDGIDRNFLQEAVYSPLPYIMRNDFATKAALAYSLLEEQDDVRVDYAEPMFFKEYVSLKKDKSKQKEFWEWWLTEAIPQAWELAHLKQ